MECGGVSRPRRTAGSLIHKRIFLLQITDSHTPANLFGPYPRSVVFRPLTESPPVLQKEYLASDEAPIRQLSLDNAAANYL